MTIVYLTLYKDGKAMPEGFKGASHGMEDEARLELLEIAVQSLGYEVSFTHEDPAQVEGAVAADEYVSIDGRRA